MSEREIAFLDCVVDTQMLTYVRLWSFQQRGWLCVFVYVELEPTDIYLLYVTGEESETEVAV